jgi:hypothetical protein
VGGVEGKIKKKKETKKKKKKKMKGYDGEI